VRRIAVRRRHRGKYRTVQAVAARNSGNIQVTTTRRILLLLLLLIIAATIAVLI